MLEATLEFQPPVAMMEKSSYSFSQDFVLALGAWL